MITGEFEVGKGWGGATLWGGWGRDDGVVWGLGVYWEVVWVDDMYLWGMGGMGGC